MFWWIVLGYVETHHYHPNPPMHHGASRNLTPIQNIVFDLASQNPKFFKRDDSDFIDEGGVRFAFAQNEQHS